MQGTPAFEEEAILTTLVVRAAGVGVSGADEKENSGRKTGGGEERSR